MQLWCLLCAVVDVGWSQDIMSPETIPHLQLHTIVTKAVSV
jgi:hypothetical protein